MTLLNLGNGIIHGAAADTKPAGVPPGTRFYETDTGLQYLMIAGTWTLISEKAQTENVTNKTLDSTNTISSATSLPTVTVAKGGTGATTATAGFDALSPMTTAGDIIIGGASGTRTKLGIGTANQLLRTNSGATAPEWASTLSGLTLTAPVISTISNTGTTTLFTATDTVVGKATTDILTNKSIDGDTNTFSNVIEMSLTKKTGYFPGASALQQTGFWGGIFTCTPLTGSGATGTQVQDSTGFRIRWATGNTINSLTGIRSNVVTAGLTSRQLNPDTSWRFVINATTTIRCGIGYISGTASPASSADPLANLSGVLFWLDSGVDGNWHIMQNDGSASSDNTTIANVAAANTSIHTIRLKAVTASAKFQYSYDGGALTDINTKIPAASTALGWIWWVECLANTAARQLDMYAARATMDG